MDIKAEEYTKDSKVPCKYGINCYQKNPLHLSKYKHPPKRISRKSDDVEPDVKKKKIDDNETYDKANTSNADVSNLETTNEHKNGELNVNKVIPAEAKVLTNFNEKEFIKNKFLVDMPPDFYSFWNFCKNLKKTNPLMALNDIGLILVGPFDVLAGKFNNIPEKEIDEYILHWRYFYDPPEFQTVIRRNDNSGYHLGYFRDCPNEMPVFLAYNFAKTDGSFTVVGDNLFAAVSLFLDFLRKTANPFMKSTILRYSNLIHKEADSLKFSLSRTTKSITSRNHKVLAKSFNKLGFVVPYNKKTQLGYRPLSVSNKELQTLLHKLDNASSAERDNLMIQLQEILTNTNIAIDECDFGTGLELGLDILCSGVESLNSVVGRLLATCYRLLNREAFAIIIESHMKARKKDFNLSIV